ncbi:MAG: hypothetical protein R3225_08380, partial [Halofilum sp. (in: g-proteobacteria)]|nr:hypothetical protein [Halofilum sp. (in: g-proteobacteria)]
MRGDSHLAVWWHTHRRSGALLRAQRVETIDNGAPICVQEASPVQLIAVPIDPPARRLGCPRS